MLGRIRKYNCHLKRVISRLLALFVCLTFLVSLLCLAAFSLVHKLSKPYIEPDLQSLSGLNVDKIMVLGARVYPDGTVSPLLKQRLDAAYQAYIYLTQAKQQTNSLKCIACVETNSSNSQVEDKPELKIIVSGSHAKNYDEAEAMANYLHKLGVNEQKIILDKEGINTLKSCQNYQTNYANETLLIVTSEYHLPRACFLARKLELRAYGFPADSYNFSWPTQVYNFVREALSRVKAVINIYIDLNFAN